LMLNNTRYSDNPTSVSMPSLNLGCPKLPSRGQF
jgi:hypothetical protein